MGSFCELGVSDGIAHSPAKILLPVFNANAKRANGTEVSTGDKLKGILLSGAPSTSASPADAIIRIVYSAFVGAERRTRG